MKNSNSDGLLSQQKLYPIFYMSPTSSKSQTEPLKLVRKRRRRNSIEPETPLTPKRPTPRRKVKLLTEQNKEQLYLDLGQSLFGHVQCKGCGMVYTNGQLDDTSEHEKFHKAHINRITFKGWRNERVVERFFEGRILLVLPSDPKHHLNKVDDILTVVDNELGYSSSHSRIKSKAKSFLFVSNEREVVGYVMAEEISEAYKICLSDEYKENHLLEDSWCCSEMSRKALIGIVRIWTLSTHRRKGLATKMLDAVREHYFFAYSVPKTLLAFSDPTCEGRALATNYCGSGSVLVYKWTS